MTPLEHRLNKLPKCNDSRVCFARINDKCNILMETYLFDGDCPFCKENRNDKRREEKHSEKLPED